MASSSVFLSSMVGKARSSNFTISEKLDLLKLVRPHIRILEEHTNKHAVIVDKNNCWDTVAEQYNSLGGDRPHRTAQGLRTLYKRLKESAKQEVMQRRHAQPEYRGSISEPTRRIMEMIPHLFHHVPNHEKDQALRRLIYNKHSSPTEHPGSSSSLAGLQDYSAGVNESPQWDPGSPRTPQSSAGSERVPETSGPAPGCVQDGVRYFSVVWCKASKKKHKRWEGDAVLVTRGRSVVLKDMEGKNIGTGSGYKLSQLASLSEGETLMIGGKEVEVMGIISAEDFAKGRCFQDVQIEQVESYTKPTPPPSHRLASKPFSPPTMLGRAGHLPVETKAEEEQVYNPRHNPLAPGALVMPHPSSNHQWLYNKSGLPVVDVVVDPHLTTHLRPHQREGILFLYECVMGLRAVGRYGAILADEMGLGKTLQSVALSWTLLKQGPYGGKPVTKRVLVVTPGSLVQNWKAEFVKWLGRERISVFTVDQEVGLKHSSEVYLWDSSGWQDTD